MTLACYGALEIVGVIIIIIIIIITHSLPYPQVYKLQGCGDQSVRLFDSLDTVT